MRTGRFQIMIHTHDHEPANVHVRAGSGVAKIQIRFAPRLVRIDGQMSRRDARRALDLVTEHQDMLRKRWEEIHGSGQADQ